MYCKLKSVCFYHKVIVVVVNFLFNFTEQLENIPQANIRIDTRGVGGEVGYVKSLVFHVQEELIDF